MWLTGFDAPSLHTMYVDKPMRGHGLMQAIARVNRVFRDKPGGVVVDYVGFAPQLKDALATYTHSGGSGRPTVDQSVAVDALRKHYEVCCGIFYGFDRSPWTEGTPAQRLALLPAAQEHVLAQEDGKDRLAKAVDALSKAFALAVPHDYALGIRTDIAFFQTVRNSLAKRAPGTARPAEELDHAVRQIIAGAVAPEGVIDIFDAAGLPKPDVSILSDEFLAEVRNMPQRNLAVDLLRKLLEDDLRTHGRKNVVQSRSFAEMLAQTLLCYRNRAVETAQVIEELIHLARQIREADRRGEDLGLSEDELAFYDALETNDSRKGARRRDVAHDSPGARQDRAPEHHDRLDPAGRRARPAPRVRQAHPTQARLPARQAGDGHEDGPATGGGAVGGVAAGGPLST